MEKRLLACKLVIVVFLLLLPQEGPHEKARIR